MGFPRAPLCVASGELAPLPEGPGSHTLRRQSPLPTPYPTRTSGKPKVAIHVGYLSDAVTPTSLKNVNPEEGQVPWGASPDAQLNMRNCSVISTLGTRCSPEILSSLACNLHWPQSLRIPFSQSPRASQGRRALKGGVSIANALLNLFPMLIIFCVLRFIRCVFAL